MNNSILKVKSHSGKTILTERETEYLSLAAMGFRNNQIAKILSVTRSSVKKTLETIFQKLKAKNRANAVTIAFLHDILNASVLNGIHIKFGLNIQNE